MTRPARWRPALLVAALGALLVLFCLLSIGLGALHIPPGEVIDALLGRPTGPRIEDVIWSGGGGRPAPGARPPAGPGPPRAGRGRGW
ncbi:hypothetical protein ACFWIP_31935 [Streptomyces anulatus]|uniref:hypothetical protein n=1 Tax=Streptomyces anulatus TaxID=1892 RepID=UPI003661B2BB